MQALSRIVVVGLALALVVGIGASKGFAQDPPKVIQVLTFDVKGDLAGFLTFAKRANDIRAKLKSRGEQRIWQAVLAGDNANTVFVGVEYPSLVAFAEDTAKASADPGWQKFLEDFRKSGTEIVSNSLSVEQTP